MNKRGGLGRGLGALIPSGGALSTAAGSSLTELPVAAVVPNRFQPREHFDEEALASLTASIREMGVLQPILVRPAVDDHYEIIAGERRWRAAKRAGLLHIPAIIREVEDTAALEHALVENLHREDLNPLEEAAAYQQLMEDFGLTQELVSQRVGRSRSAVANTLRLFQLPPSLQRMIADGRLTAGHARALLATPDRDLQEELADEILNRGLSVRDVEQLVRDRMAPKLDPVPEPEPDAPVVPSLTLRPHPPLREPAVLELEELLSARLNTRVSVSLTGKRGRVVVEFADLDDLERIYRVITPPGTVLEP
ncbi:MAG: ParB/RepB/Spo0J family partition protein [Actinobacteria bacterium]|nr:MAG: ParB/RepB/Spo0J family partition protein [Actinomycetota bacterium]